MAKKKAEVVRYANYYRCSSDDQAHGDFTTIDTQKEIDARHVEAVGGVLIGEYNDEGKTGTNLKRNGWRQMLADAQARKFDKVCITYMSRLGRGDAYVIAEHELGKFGVQVEMVKESFSDDLAGYMGKSMTIMMDGMYPKMVSGWTKTKQAEMVKKGYFCGA